MNTKSKRLGRVIIPWEMYNDIDIDNGCSIFNGAFIIDAKRNFETRHIEILMLHRSFREIDASELVPKYIGHFKGGVFEGWSEDGY